MATGATMPPIAAAAGIVSRWRSRSSPRSSSRLASSPTTRKKNVISPWLTQWRRSSEIPPSPSWIDRCVVQTDSYESDQGELAHTSAATAATSRTAALPVSLPTKSRIGAARLRAQAVRSLNVLPLELASLITRAYAYVSQEAALSRLSFESNGRRRHEGPGSRRNWSPRPAARAAPRRGGTRGGGHDPQPVEARLPHGDGRDGGRRRRARSRAGRPGRGRGAAGGDRPRAHGPARGTRRAPHRP